MRSKSTVGKGAVDGGAVALLDVEVETVDEDDTRRTWFRGVDAIRAVSRKPGVGEAEHAAWVDVVSMARRGEAAAGEG